MISLLLFQVSCGTYYISSDLATPQGQPCTIHLVMYNVYQYIETSQYSENVVIQYSYASVADITTMQCFIFLYNILTDNMRKLVYPVSKTCYSPPPPVGHKLDKYMSNQLYYDFYQQHNICCKTSITKDDKIFNNI